MRERKLGLLGRKVGMTRIFDAAGQSVGVTVLEVGPCLLLAKRSKEKNAQARTDGYTALQLGFGTKLARKVNKAEAGHLAKVGGPEKAQRFVREVRVSDATAAKFEVGQEVSLAALDLKEGDLVDVVATSKGRGFQGVMRRHNFKGFPMSHGTHETRRHGGSIGNRKWPGRVFKGRKMPGHMGDERVTIQNLRVAQVRMDDNVVLVHGSVPGAKNGWVVLRPAIKENPLP